MMCRESFSSYDELRHDAGIAGVIKLFFWQSSRRSRRIFLVRNRVIQFGYPPLRIDLLTSVAGLKFAEAGERKVGANYGRQEVHFISKPYFQVGYTDCLLL